MNIRIKKLNPDATIPIQGSEEAAGFDLYVCDDRLTTPLVIYPGETVMLKTGLAMAIPKGYFGAIYARSGLATKKNLRPANCVGVVDSDYRGEVMVALHNDSRHDFRSVQNGDRIAQLIIQEYLSARFEEVDDLDDTERGAGGFGHTGN